MTTTAPAARSGTYRRPVAVVAIIITVALALLGHAWPAFASGSGTLASLVNRDRAAHALPALARSASLDAIAVTWAHHMADSGRMSHNPNLATQAPAGWRALGENVAMGQPTPEAMEAAWMASPGHRANILGDYTHVGVAFIVANGQVWGVEVFAKYATAPPKTAAPPAKAPVQAAPAPVKNAPVAPNRPAEPAPAQARPAPATPAPTPTIAPTATPAPTAAVSAESALPTPTVVATATPVALRETAATDTAPFTAPLGVAVLLMGLGIVIVGMVRRRRT
jgi:hypothetical protein